MATPLPPAGGGSDERGLVAYSAPYSAQTRSLNPGQGMLMPLAEPDVASAAIDAYERLKSAIVRPSDIQVIQSRDFLKKSFWRRVAACFGLSLEMVSEERLVLDGKLAYRVTCRAIAPNGRTMDGDGMCMQGEKGQMIEHNIRAIAHTRAKNRAIADIVGGGEVSAEEMPDEEEHIRPRPAAQRPAALPATAPMASPMASPAVSASMDERVAKALRNQDILGLLTELGMKEQHPRRVKVAEVIATLDARAQAVTVSAIQTALAAEADEARDAAMAARVITELTLHTGRGPMDSQATHVLTNHVSA